MNDRSELRSKLELLGGRSVQVTSPGHGREDFPGSLQLIIDSTGTALAPPRAAERLSGLLEQLQADYDDELTKTIDELLGSTFIEHLRDRLAEAELLRDDINKKLAQNRPRFRESPCACGGARSPRNERRTTCWIRWNSTSTCYRSLPRIVSGPFSPNGSRTRRRPPGLRRPELAVEAEPDQAVGIAQKFSMPPVLGRLPGNQSADPASAAAGAVLR